MYIADFNNSRVRWVDVTGTIHTLAGNGTNGYSGDGGLGTDASLSGPNGVAVDASGNVLVADMNNMRIRKVTAPGGPDFLVGNAALANSGSYSVVISNTYGSVTSSVASLRVANPPFSPKLQGTMAANGTLSFAWSAAIGQNYQVEYSTNLSSTNWFPLGGPAMATNSSMLTYDALTGGQRFYRVLLQP
jgi:hypothetical protein